MPKLLIVDDEEDVREFAKKFFARRQIDVFTAAGGREALETIENEKPDLVLLDMRMEEMTGLQVLEHLKEKRAAVKVIMVTGVEDKDIILQAHKLGIKGYINKPLILEDLERIVMEELGKE